MGEMRVVSVKFPEDLLKEIDYVAAQNRITRSELIRRAVQIYLRIFWKEWHPKPKFVKLDS